MGSQAGISQRHIFLHKRVEFKTSRSRYNNIDCLEQHLIIQKEIQTLAWYDCRRKQIFKPYSAYIMEADDFYSRNSVSDIISADLKMSFGKYYPEHENPRRQNLWVVNPFDEQKEEPFSKKKPFNLLNYHRTKDSKILLILWAIRNCG